MVSKRGFYDPNEAEFLDPTTKRRVAIVTGGNSGIGKTTVLNLYLHGYVVYIAGRSQSRVEKAIEEVKIEAEKRVLVYTEDVKATRWIGELHFIHFDCNDLQSVVSAAEEFIAKEPKLHVLINNAGIMAQPYEETKDGFEIQYQVNFVAPFLFTLKLVPALQKAEVDQKPRVVCVSSTGHTMSRSYHDPAKPFKNGPEALNTYVRYGVAKTAEIQFVKKFAELYPDIVSIAVHPGIILSTNLLNYQRSQWVFSFFNWLFLGLAKWLVAVSDEEGCLATLRGALDPALEKESGAYLETGGVVGTPSKIASNKEYIDRTWNYTTERLKEKSLL